MMGTAVKMSMLYWRLLRYRVAVMILLFMLLGAAWHGALSTIGLPMFSMVAALASSYVCATSVNDIADREIDVINHPGDEGRPLVTGAADARELWTLFGASGVIALSLPLLAVSAPASGVMGLSLAVGALYSLPPVKLSYRTFLAPPALAAAYVGIPYLAGVVTVGERLEAFDLPLLAALFLLFVGRIVLKDFRDREGDAAHGKPTFLLRYGKKRTCLVSLAAVCAGDALLVAALSDEWWLAALLQPYVASVLVMLHRLYQAEKRREEQIAIGVGAKMGNGLLITLLGVLILAGQDAEQSARVAFALALIALYAVNFVDFLRRPDRAAIGYKG